MATCHQCKGRVVKKSIRHVHRWGNEIIILDDVPAEVCLQCGEVYFSPEVLERMDKATLTEARPKTTIPIPVLSWPEVTTA